MTATGPRKRHEAWLLELTGTPTAAGREQRVIAWIESWVKRRRSLRLDRDRAGNLLIRRTERGRSPAPIFFQAHLDHPAFVVRKALDDRTVELEFRGGVHDAYFVGTRIELIDANDERYAARIESLDPSAKPFKRVTARLTRATTRHTRATDAFAPGDIGVWAFTRVPRIQNGLLHAPACDDLAGVAAALCALDRLRSAPHVGVLLTRAEEIGFVGTLAACEDRTIPRSARLLCLENSRSFAESPIGGGPILRVGDRLSVFSPELTNELADVLTKYERTHKDFRWQRRLMPGGACEATAFSAYGYASTCLCLPLGNYHNMAEIDQVRAGHRVARIGPEFISVADFHHLVEALVACIQGMDGKAMPSLRDRLTGNLERGRHVLSE